MLSLTETIKKLQEVKDFTPTKNFFYEVHTCEDGSTSNVKMDYKLKDDRTGEIVRFGWCGVCKTCYYHEDHESSRY